MSSGLSLMREFALFLKDYGPYAGATIFFILYFLEKKAHSLTRREYIDYLKAAPKEFKDFGSKQALALARIEQSLRKSSRG